MPDTTGGHPAALKVVTLDGPAGVGKTTLARRVADALGIPYLDTGGHVPHHGVETRPRRPRSG